MDKSLRRQAVRDFNERKVLRGEVPQQHATIMRQRLDIVRKRLRDQRLPLRDLVRDLRAVLFGRGLDRVVDDRRTAEVWSFERSQKSRDPHWVLVRVDPASA